MYKKEELKIMNMEKIRATNFELTRDNAHNIRNENRGKEYPTIYKIESELSLEEKIDFIDEVKEGLASYMLNILNLWDLKKEDMPKDTYGNTKTVSKKAWIKKNDNLKIIDDWYKYGNYQMFKTKYSLYEKDRYSLIVPKTEYGYTLLYSGQHVVHQWFHDLLNELEIEELKYFRTIDSKQIKLTKVREFGDRYRETFNDKKLNDIIWNRLSDVTEQELDIYIKAFETLEKSITDIGIKLYSDLKQEQE